MLKKTDIMKDIYSYKDFTITEPLVFKDVDGKKGIVTGYFANFDSLDSDGDVIKAGAFSKTIAQQGPGSPQPRIKHLINHNPYQPLGVLLNLTEDNKGLLYESKIGSHTLGQDFIKMAESGLITEHSIGFKTIKFNQLKPNEDWKDGEAVRELTELKLYEGSSLTAWGANPNTPLMGIKSNDLQTMINRAKQIDSFCYNTTASDETIKSLLLYNKQLLESIADLQIDLPTEEDTKEAQEEEVEEPIAEQRQEVVECPHCKKQNYNSDSMIKCRNCNKSFIPGVGFAFNF